MKPTEKARRLWLAGALLATLLVAQWVSGEEGEAGPETLPDSAEAPHFQKEAPAGRNAPENEAAELDLGRLERRKFSAQAGDIFGQRSWVPPPRPEPPRRPSPPPMEFRYLGKVVEGNETRVFLALGERNYIVRPGESINNQYRLDEVSDRGITFTYLPLNARQMLATAGTANIP
ncbi:secretion system X translation initiation factor [Nitrosospira multiformis]|uniref:secretion system X translation initiation factor n=1 Tax=Nitrosospira multiformis TaxID=1231 RepID=UPI00089C932E|nr:secretion system X translation initiation factor [Nitrosospira multiformis]SEA16721.1 hypothetical protein SAMN05216411_105132 [Nitrosospira multiformis]